MDVRLIVMLALAGWLVASLPLALIVGRYLGGDPRMQPESAMPSVNLLSTWRDGSDVAALAEAG